MGCRSVSVIVAPTVRSMDGAALRLAGSQFGAIASNQLTHDLGWSPSRVARARRAGTLVPVTRRVVRVASSAETMYLRCMALQLHTAEVGFVSGWTAARLHGFRKMPAEPIHFTIPEGRRLAVPPWARINHTSWYNAEIDRMRRPDGLLVATPLRTLFGLAASFNQHRFERAAEDAWHLGLVTPGDAAAYLADNRCRGKDGVSIIERWLERAITQARPAQSDLERELIEALDRVGLPPCTRQHPLTLPNGDTIHLDIAWPDIRLAVEPGAAWWHGGDLAQQRDQARDLAAGELGWQVFRLAETVRQDPDGAARRIKRVVEQRRHDLGHRNPRG